MPLRQLSPDPQSDHDAGMKIDIIAVHGLNPRSKSDADHAWDTWRTPSGPNGHLWLRDDLPEAVPYSRIFLYQYNATLAFGQDRDTFNIKATELLEAIRIEREDAAYRPILFMGHSMGGLLIKQAMINAHNNPKYSSIKLATKGLVFFATPHHGGNPKLGTFGNLAAKIAIKVGFQKGDIIHETLEQGNIFSEIFQGHWKHQLLQYSIVSFWGSLDEIVSENMARLGMPGKYEHVVELRADHTSVCRFGSDDVDEDNRKLVLFNIRDVYRDTLNEVERSTGDRAREFITKVKELIDKDNDRELAIVIKDNGLDLNVLNLENACPEFCYAAHHGKVKTCKLLLEHPGVDVDIADPVWSQRPLFRAVKEETGDGRHLKIAQLLLDSKKVDINAKERDGKTALIVTAQIGIVEGVKMLLTAGADRDILDAKGKSPLDYAKYGSENSPELRLRQNFEQIVAELKV